MDPGFCTIWCGYLTGTLIEIGAGRREASKLPVVIAAEDRELAGFLAPARGLVFKKSILLGVKYILEGIYEVYFLECEWNPRLRAEGVYGFFSRRRMQIFSVFRRRRCRKDRLILMLPGYHQYWNYAVKKGYSGTAVFTKERAPCCYLWHGN